MTDKVIIYNKPDGVLAVCIPAQEWRLPNEAEDAWLKRVIARSVPADARDVRIVSSDAIPTDRTFRNAWTHKSGEVSVDMAKARDIHLYRIRRKRKALFRALDAEYQRADETGDPRAKAEVASRKQRLRDATKHPDIVAAKTPEQLKAVWPLPSA
jgi:hypothetical protein